MAGKKKSVTLQKELVDIDDHIKNQFDDQIKKQFDNFLSEDDFDSDDFDSSDEMLEEETRLGASSIPIGEYAEKTRGMQPRSRMPVTRESQTRKKQDLMDKFNNEFTQEFKGRLHIKQENIPNGYSIFWGAKSVKGHSRQDKLTKLYEEGFFHATAEDFPERAYRDYNGELDDSTDIIDCGANTLLLRDNDVNRAHLNHFEKISTDHLRTVEEHQDRPDPFDKSQNDRFFPTAPHQNGMTKMDHY